MKRSITSLILIFSILAAFCFIMILPIYMAVLNSLKTSPEIYQSILALPKKLHFENYITAIAGMDFVRVTINTLIVTILSVTGIVLLGSMAGYKLSRTKGMLSNIVFLIFISSMLIPFPVIMITLINVTKAINVHDKLIGLVLVYIGIGINLPIFLYHGFVKGIPKDLDDSARIEGCNDLQAFAYIVFPLLKPITVTVAILLVVWIWNDFLLPLVMLTNAKRYTLILATSMFYSSYAVEWEKVLAAVLITSIPVVLFYLAFQKYIVKGITSGSIKG